METLQKSYHKILKACYFVSALTTIFVLLTLVSNQPPVHEGGRFRGRQSGRKCGDVDESMSDHGTYLFFRKERVSGITYFMAKF